MDATTPSHPATMRPERAGGTAYVPPYGWAAVAAGLVLALYALTLAPTTQFWDASEYITVAEILGIPHPPGNPLFVILASAWNTILQPTGLATAVRINLLSAAMSAAAHGLWFLIVHRTLAGAGVSRRTAALGAGLAVTLSATAFTVWNQSNVNEKVYTVSLATVALVTWLALRWRDRVRDGRGARRHLVLIAYLLALSVGNHLMAFLVAPALLVFLLRVRPRSLLDWRLYPACALVAVLGLSVHLFLPIRAGLDPVINEADPECRSLGGAAVSVVTLGNAGCESLSGALQRRQYAKPGVLTDPVTYPRERAPRSPALIGAQLANWAQYFDWQWARSLGGDRSWFGWPRPLFTLLFLGLGIAGAWGHARSDRDGFLFAGVLFLTLSLGLTGYLNFKYGFSYPDPDIGFGMREVRERDYFFLLGFSVWGLWAGGGLLAFWRRLAHRARALGWPRPRRLTAPVLALALLPLVLNWGRASRAGDYAARDWAYNVLMSVEPYAVLITNGDNDTFPLWYLQEVEGVRRDVTVAVSTYLNTSWYVKQLRALTRPCPPGVDPAERPTRVVCQRRLDLDAVPPALRRRFGPDPPAPPAAPVIGLTDAQIDRIAARPLHVEQPLSLRAGPIDVRIRPGTVLLPAETFTSAILRSAIGDRPIHFTGANQAVRKLGLVPSLVRQGLTFRLSVHPAGPAGEPAVREIGAGAVVGHYVDAAWTETLLEDVFVHHGAAGPGAWPDPSTLSIPGNYAWAHQAVSEAHRLAGDDAGAREHTELAYRWLGQSAPAEDAP